MLCSHIGCLKWFMACGLKWFLYAEYETMWWTKQLLLENAQTWLQLGIQADQKIISGVNKLLACKHRVPGLEVEKSPVWVDITVIVLLSSSPNWQSVVFFIKTLTVGCLASLCILIIFLWHMWLNNIKLICKGT
jgi:hypothetical protein